MDLTSTFDALASEWTAHCERVAWSSNPAVYTDCPAFPKLVALGAPALPLAMERYAADERVPWEALVAAITGTSMIDDLTSFDPDEVRRKRLEWWERQLTT